MKNKQRDKKRKDLLAKGKPTKPPKSYFQNNEVAFLTPVDYKPRTVTTFYSAFHKVRTEVAKYRGFLAGNGADFVAELVGLNPAYKTEVGIWIVSKSKWKQIKRLGIKVESKVDPEFSNAVA